MINPSPMEETTSSSEDDSFKGVVDTHQVQADDIEVEGQESLKNVTVEADDIEVEGQESSKNVTKTSYTTKLRELLRNLYSEEIKIYSEASKEFIRLLRGDSGGEMLYEYVEASPLCSELVEAWKFRKEKPGLAHVLSLISAILDHPNGKYKADDLQRITISRRLDKLSRSIIETKLEEVYTELNSKEAKRQNAALSLMAAIVRRGVGLASEVAKTFDFKRPVFNKLAEYQMKKVAKKGKYRTRSAFIEFAMSFLEIGNPRLLRWILQQKDMYSGVLRGLGSDDDETVVYVLSTLRDKVLTPDSLVPPGLRSVLFGSVTLDQLVSISGNLVGGPPAKIAHEVLVMVCTDPRNGLMPDPKAHNPLKGNRKRLLDLMKKLRATEVGYHRDLLLAIVKGMPYFGSAYMDEFPYVLEPRSSSTWFAAVSLATDLVSSARSSSPFGSISSPPSFDSSEVKCLLKCIIPRAFSRIVINRGLLHSDILVRHGSVMLLLEALKSLDCLIGAINCDSRSNDPVVQKWVSLKQEIQDEARAVLPDPQVLLKLLSSLSANDLKSSKISLKRARESEKLPDTHSTDGVKKLKSHFVNEDIKLIISGIGTESDDDMSKERKEGTSTSIIDEFYSEKDSVKAMAGNEVKDAEIYFHSMLLDALAFYLRSLPTALEGSFDFFKILPSNPFTLSTSQQKSLLSLLIEYIGWSSGSKASSLRPPEAMYKHLLPLINLFLYSTVKDIHDQSYILAQAAMLSTGAFDRNKLEIDAWLSFLPGYRRDKFSLKSQGIEIFRDLSSVTISFLCDAVSTVGNNLYKFLEQLRGLISNLKCVEEASPDFGPLIICILNKCLRLLESDSRTFKLHEKSMISTYVCNSLSYIIQTQVGGELLSAVIDSILTEKFGDCSLVDDDSGNFLSEWRPLKNLLLFSRSVSNQLAACISSYSIAPKISSPSSHSFAKTLGKIKKIKKSVNGDALVGVASSFCSSIICTAPDEILDNFPSAIIVSQYLLGEHLSFLSSIFFCERSFLASVAFRWPDIFFSGLEMVEDCREENAHVLMRTDISSTEELISSMDFNSIESNSVAFSFFLRHAPFHVLVPAIIGIQSSNMSGSTKILDFLRTKLCYGSTDDSIASLRYLLFWVYQTQSICRDKPPVELEQLSETCLELIKYMLAQLLVVKSDFDSSKIIEAPVVTPHIQEVIETVLHHPVVTTSLSHPLLCTNESLRDSFEIFSISSKWGVHQMENNSLSLLTTVADYLLALGNGKSFISEVEDVVYKRLVKDFKNLVQRFLFVLRDKFDMCIENKESMPLVQTYYIFHPLIRFISPFVLFELVHWMLCKVELNESLSTESFMVSAFSIGCHIAESAFDLLSSNSHQRNTNAVNSCLFWEGEGERFDISLLEKIYDKVLEFATIFKLQCADLCLVKALNIVYKQKFVQPQTVLLPSIMEMSRVIMSSPTKLLAHCIHGTNATKAKLMFLLTEISPLHLTLFGQIFLCIMSKDLSLKGNVIEENRHHDLSDEEFMMLLPVALSYLKLNFMKFGMRDLKHIETIPSFYSRILLDVFLNWKRWVSGNIFKEEYGESLLSSTQELFNFFSGSLLGKAIQMLQYYFALNEDSTRMKERMKLFDSINLCSGVQEDLFDCDVSEINVCSLEHSLNFTNRVIAKISLSRILLFPKENLIEGLLTETNGDSKEINAGMGSNIEEFSLRFINILVSTLHKIVKRFPLVTDNSKNLKSTECSQLFRYLEAFILRNIVELCMKLQNYLIKLPSLPFLEQFMRSSLVHRFEDPHTLKVLRNVIISLSEGKFDLGVVFDLLLAHSQFIPTIMWSDTISNSSGFSHAGTLSRPISGILKSNLLLCTNQDSADLDVSVFYRRKLEVIKLLRVLYHLKTCQNKIVEGEDATTNSRELLSLLLSCYGSTMSEIDVEMLNLLHEIVSTKGSDCVSFSEMDYLWGSSASKLRKEKTLEKVLSSNNITDCETTEECRRRQFRENVSLDSKFCVATILHFPNDKVACNGDMSLKKLQHDNFIDMFEKPSGSIEKIQMYDPAFILDFSKHGLAMGYFEPLEFAGLGLLAIAFMSISSPDEGMRKLGYEVLGVYKNVLENCRNRKDGLRLRLLLTYLQNGIAEPWQRIPSITAIFAAEASFILLDPSHDHYRTISKLLMRSSSMNLKSIPLFHSMFGSISVNFKTDRLWILRLIYAGLSLEDDAQIFMRKSVLEILLSFYVSSLSDYESKLLILQIVKKSVKLPMLARYLVEHCGLIPWLSGVLSFCYESLYGDDQNPFVTHMKIVLEVVNDVISLRKITDWLQKCALEQLSELSSHVHKLFVDGLKTMKQNVSLVTSILQILVSTLRISQKRKLYQPHFTLSHDGLFHLYQALDDESCNEGPKLSAELGLRAVLMSPPPTVMKNMDKAKLLRFVMRGISTATISKLSGEQQYEDSTISKLLRWVIASAILSKISGKAHKIEAIFTPERSNTNTLQLLLEHIKNGQADEEQNDCDEDKESDCSNDVSLAASILYLQQLLGMDCKVLPSVVAALCILLLPDASNNAGTISLVGDQSSFVTSLCSRIRCPAEVNPAWRWSYYQPWKDLSLELTETQKMDERHACQSLLVIFSNSFGGKSLSVLSHLDLEDIKYN